MSKHVVILGGGIGGLATAYNLRKLDSSLRITVVSGRPYFGFTPSYPHLALGWRKFEDISIPLANLLPKHGIDFVNEDGESIDPDANKVKTKGGKVIEYDYLVIATGPKLVFGAEGQEQYSTSVCTAEHAMELNKRLEEFYRNPGPVVIGAIPGVSCFGPAYEFAFMLHYELKRRGLRHRVPITYITSEPYVGHLGLGGVGYSRRIMEDLFAERSIKYIANVKITKVEPDKVIYEDLEGKTYEVPAKLSMIMPRFMGTDVVASAGDKVANPANKMVIVNRCFQNPTYKNIFGVGVVTAIPPVEQTPIPTGAPKTGMMIEQMAMAVAHNIVNDIRNNPDRYAPELAAICIADMGKDAAFFYAAPVLPPRATVIQKKGVIWHYAKSAFEKYFLWKIKAGNIAPVFEEKALHLVFGTQGIRLCADCSGAPGTC
ncbi:NAD(P)/FAD-dependent oxidoreductase [Thermocrinis minervae]|uniref:Sulfide-quinone reductase n=1 Tax=Thermocrinis minervae TaxID=381751 RepID=A0A1M6SM99_9AQUI|nr:FAD/NAD(P)-binding oxidoreductase [Thermocrinis minervae]SHK45835.1 sulfide-quinone oxidoreductase [Thermocrinis minervae]